MTEEIIKRKPGRPRKVIDVIATENQSGALGDAPVHESPAPDVGPIDAVDSNRVVEAEAEPSRPSLPHLDHDHDGAPGGSWPLASLTENETRGLIAEFYEAYESQVETKRVDNFNRVWSFRHEAIKSQDTMVLSVKRGPVEKVAEIPASMARFRDIGEVLAELDRMTAR